MGPQQLKVFWPLQIKLQNTKLGEMFRRLQKTWNDTVDGSEIPNNHPWDVYNLMNNGVKYQPQLVIAGFLPSTVAPRKSKDCRLYIIYIVYIYICYVQYYTLPKRRIGNRNRWFTQKTSYFVSFGWTPECLPPGWAEGFVDEWWSILQQAAGSLAWKPTKYLKKNKLR